MLVAIIEKVDPIKHNDSKEKEAKGSDDDVSQQENTNLDLKPILLPEFSGPTGNLEIENEIKEMYNHVKYSLQATDHSSVYFRKFEVSIEVQIIHDRIKVKSAYTICFVNPYHIDFTFKRNPVLHDGLKNDTYTWTSVIYQGQPCMERIQ